MCCDNTPGAMRKARKLFGSHKTRTCWKGLLSDGRSAVRYFPHGPGTHKVDFGGEKPQYNRRFPQGIHVYWSKPSRHFAHVVPVICHRDDLIAAAWCDPKGRGVAEAVFTKIRIRKDAWEKVFPGAKPHKTHSEEMSCEPQKRL